MADDGTAEARADARARELRVALDARERELEQARAAVRKMEAEKREVLGARHPDTLNAMGNLASTLREGGEHEEAEAMERERRDLEA